MLKLRASLRARRNGELYSGVHSASDFPHVSLEPSDNGPYRNHNITNTLLYSLSRRFLVFRGILRFGNRVCRFTQLTTPLKKKKK